MKKSKKSSKSKRLTSIKPLPKEKQVQLLTVALESLDDKVYLLDKQKYYGILYNWRTKVKPMDFVGQLFKELYA